MSGTERELQHAIRLAMGRHPTVRLFRNQVGECDYLDREGKRRHVTYGLCKGSSDLIGWRTLELVNFTGRIAQFSAVELKADMGRLSAEQRLFIHAVRERGGLAAICRTVEEAVALFDQPLPGLTL